MRYLLLIPVVYAAAVVETSLGDVLAVGRVTPDLLALVAVLWVVTSRSRWAFLAAGAIGLASDLIAPGRLGVGMACFFLVGYGLAQLRAKLPTDHLAARVPVVAAAVTLLAALLATAHGLLGDVPGPLPPLVLRALGAGAYTAGLALPVLMILSWTGKPVPRRAAAVRSEHWARPG
jgi:rod shape-determining protein MreD